MDWNEKRRLNATIPMLPIKRPVAKPLLRFQRVFAAIRAPSIKTNKLNRSGPASKRNVNKTHTAIYENRPRKICGVGTVCKF